MNSRPWSIRSLADLTAASDTLRMRAEPTRLHLMWQLSAGLRTVTELTEASGVPRIVLSHHWASSASVVWSTPAKMAGISSIPSATDTSSGSFTRQSTTQTTVWPERPVTDEQPGAAMMNP
ncbi:MAG TPA: hypothetical protein VIM08_12975 [Arthrobacter sp.]